MIIKLHLMVVDKTRPATECMVFCVGDFKICSGIRGSISLRDSLPNHFPNRVPVTILEQGGIFHTEMFSPVVLPDTLCLFVALFVFFVVSRLFFFPLGK